MKISKGQKSKISNKQMVQSDIAIHYLAAFAWCRCSTWIWLVVGLGFCALVPACQSPSAPVIASIGDDQMARIMADLNIAEAATARLNGYPKDSLMHGYFQQVMEMHRMTKQTYEAQLRVIASDQVRLENLLLTAEKLLEDTVEEKTEPPE